MIEAVYDHRMKAIMSLEQLNTLDDVSHFLMASRVSPLA
ncbi:MAG: hypothetical protein ACI9GE_000570 [Oceanospirillaceae bacterium]|jgi:hypothetical protein